VWAVRLKASGRANTLVIISVDSSGFTGGAVRSPPMERPLTPLALLRAGATVLPRPLLDRLAKAVVRGLDRSHPKLLPNLARLEPAVIHIAPTDLPYRFVLGVGREPVTLDITDRVATGADAEVAASVATLVDLLEGRIDSDTLFFRRDLTVSGNTAVIVGLRNVVDRDEIRLGDELAALCGPLARPSRVIARVVDRALDRLGARVGAMHRTLHPTTDAAKDVTADIERCTSEIAALTARLAKLEARQKRRDEKTP
jgi:predicted lipid carrier protein YhbT